jgi:ethanolamine utilization protein EutA
LVAVEADMAKALGQAIALEQGENPACLCIDRVQFATGDYLDVGLPVGPALPVVVKTIVLN